MLFGRSDFAGSLGHFMPWWSSMSSSAVSLADQASGGGRCVPPPLRSLCVRTAAIYVTTSLYQFHAKQQSVHSGQGHSGHLGDDPDHDGPAAVQEPMWEEAFPLLDQHFFQLVPAHLYEQFLDDVLRALQFASSFDQTGQQLTQYIILFFPREMKRYRAQKYMDKVMMPTISCLHKCIHIEELYLEKAESPGVTTYLLAHILKFTREVKVLSLPKQCDDDVVSIIGINCKKLESIVLTDTNVTNAGLSWLLCCKSLHMVIMPGFFGGITPKGVALLLNGLPGLRHIVFDGMSDVLTFVDFNTSFPIMPSFGLRTILFHSMEQLSSNHLELVTKLCPSLQWLSLDSALFYNLEGLGRLPQLRLLRLNYKSRPVDQTVVDFFDLNGHGLTTLHLFDVQDLTLEALSLTVGQCPNVETVVLYDCSVLPDWRSVYQFQQHPRGGPQPWHCRSAQLSLSTSVRHVQLFALQMPPDQLPQLLCLMHGMQLLDMDHCDLDVDQVKWVLHHQSNLQTIRCSRWSKVSDDDLNKLSAGSGHCQLQTGRNLTNVDEESPQRTLAASLLEEYADFAPVLSTRDLQAKKGKFKNSSTRGRAKLEENIYSHNMQITDTLNNMSDSCKDSSHPCVLYC